MSKKKKKKNKNKDGTISVERLEEKDKSFGNLFKKSFSSTSKQIIWMLVVNGILWVWASYILAAFGKEQIAESLSTTVCTTILGATITYLCTATVQNISQYNPLVGGTPTSVLKSKAAEVVNSVIDPEEAMDVAVDYIDNNLPEENSESPSKAEPVTTPVKVDPRTSGPGPDDDPPGMNGPDDEMSVSEPNM